MVKTIKDQWNANLYDQSHSFVSKYGTDLLQLLDPKQKEKILDLGCGTGDLANKITETNAFVIGVDNSVNMVEQAKNKYPHIIFEVKDATKLDYFNEFEAVFSNATLHWVKPPEKALESIFKSLKPGGRFVAEFGGEGNVQIITNEVIKQIKESAYEFNPENYPWFYPSIGQYSSLMEQVGFRVTFAQHFDRPTELKGENGLRNWIDMFGSQLLEGLELGERENLITKVEQSLKKVIYNEGSWFADYKRIRVVGIKEL